MNKWLLILPIIMLVFACNRKTSLNTGTSEELTPKSGEIVTPPVKVYDDIKANVEGTMLSEKELANKICFCSYELTRMNEDIKRYHRNNDKNSLLRVQSKIDPAFAKFDKCMAEVKAKYPKAVAENDPKEVFTEVEKQCPGVVEIMEVGNKKLTNQ